MRMSQLFTQTQREEPAGIDTTSHALLLRAGYIQQLAAGIFSYLPLGQRIKQRIEAIMREELNAIGGQELLMPVVQPADIWQASGRWSAIGFELGRLQDKNGRDMALAMTHEEAVTDIARRQIQSHRQLPQLIYHIQTKWRDDPRPRAGLIRAREFTMLDSYSLDKDKAGLVAQYESHLRAYDNIFRRCGLPVISVEGDVGAMGGDMAHEFMYLTPIGEDTLLLCDDCDYRANRQVAAFQKSQPAGSTTSNTATQLAIEKVATPNCKTIADLAQFLNIATSQTAKAVFMVADVPDGDGLKEQFVFAVLRGDMELNETKLSNAVGAVEHSLRPATDEEIRAIGAEPGYASPAGLDTTNFTLVVDEAVSQVTNLVAGANETGYHLLNTNYGRDYTADILTDIAAAQDGDACPNCGAPLRAVRGVEVGNIFQLMTYYSQPMGATFTADDGSIQPIVMGSYGIGVGRLIASIAEEHHDDYGLMWPLAVAPFQVHLVALRGGFEVAEEIYAELKPAGFSVLFDDRDESPGVKFNDADLLGMPLRLTVGKRSLKQGGIEAKLRSKSERHLIPRADLLPFVQTHVER